MMNEFGEPKSIDEIIDSLSLEMLAYENMELKNIRLQAKETENPEKITVLRERYQEIAQNLTNEAKDQFGIMFASALMRKYSGDVEGFKSELIDAQIFAYGFGWTEIGQKIGELINALE